MRKSFYRLLICSMPLLLTACGEGWEAQRTTEVFPYGNARTAGSGVVYVRAKMMPEKELVVEPQAEVQPAPAQPAINADKVFHDSQMKGGAPKPSASAAPAASATTVPAPQEVKKEASLQGQVGANAQPTSMAADQAVASVTPAAGTMLAPPMTKAVEGAKAQVNHVVVEDGKVTPANVVSSPKRDVVRANLSGASMNLNTGMESAEASRHPQEMEVSVSGVGSPNGALAPPPPTASIRPVQVNAVAASSDDMISMQKSEIVTPKKDLVKVNTSEGRHTLDQIYENPF